MFDDKTEATTADILRLAAISAARLSQLEKEGVVRRAGRDAWPLVTTINKLFDAARARASAASSARQRFEEARAAREELKTSQLRGELCKFSDVLAKEAQELALLFAKLDSLPARITRDLALRKNISEAIAAIRNEWCDEMQRKIKKLETQ